ERLGPQHPELPGQFHALFGFREHQPRSEAVEDGEDEPRLLDAPPTGRALIVFAAIRRSRHQPDSPRIAADPGKSLRVRVLRRLRRGDERAAGSDRPKRNPKRRPSIEDSRKLSDGTSKRLERRALLFDGGNDDAQRPFVAARNADDPRAVDVNGDHGSVSFRQPLSPRLQESFRYDLLL